MRRSRAPSKAGVSPRVGGSWGSNDGDGETRTPASQVNQSFCSKHRGDDDNRCDEAFWFHIFSSAFVGERSGPPVLPVA